MANLAVVGCGYWGRNLVRVFNELGVLRLVCDADPVARHFVTETYPGVAVTDSSEAVAERPEIDAVVIATPAVTHAALAKLFLEADKDVFVEKPLALTSREAVELNELAVARGRILMVGHLLEYHPAVLTMLRYIREGRLGKIYTLFANRLNFGKIRREENILWSFAPHDVSIFLMLAGEMPERAWCMGGAFLNPGVADRTISYFTFPSGIHGQINVSWLHPFKEHRLVVTGSRGMLVHTDSAPTNKLLFFPHTVDWVDGRVPTANKSEPEPVPYDDLEPLKEECRHFLACVAERQTPRSDGRDGIRVLTVLEACQRSLDQGGIPVPVLAQPVFTAHETALVHPLASVGRGTKIWQNAQIAEGAVVGERCTIGHNCVVYRQATLGNGVKLECNIDVWPLVTLEDDVFVGPSAVFTNDLTPRAALPKGGKWVPTLVKRGASIGANATIVCGVTIGQHSAVAAGAVVTKVVPDYALVAGVPAKFVRWICRCNQWGEVVAFPSGSIGVCQNCGARYERTSEGIRELTEESSAVPSV